jgi:hypothetical protein
MRVVEASTFSKQSAHNLSALRTGRALPTGRCLVLISGRGHSEAGRIHDTECRKLLVHNGEASVMFIVHVIFPSSFLLCYALSVFTLLVLV